MHGVSVDELDSAGGAQLTQANSWYTLNGKNVVVVGDAVTPHGDGAHASPVMAEGEPWYRVNTIPVSRQGHLANCGHPTTGQNWYRLLKGELLVSGSTEIKARKGTYFYGGAGMNGDYIADFVRALRETGIDNARTGNEATWSYQSNFTLMEMVLDASIGVQAFHDGEHQFLPMGLQDYGVTGSQFNLIGYSYGALVSAQVAIKYARQFNGVTDNLVLLGAPISQDFLDDLHAEPNIKKIHIIDLAEYGDPIYAGMTYIELLEFVPTLGLQYQEDTGHFYYSKDGENGRSRRKQLADDLYSKGLR